MSTQEKILILIKHLCLSPILYAQSKEQARQPIGGSDSSSCDTSSTNGHQQRQHIKSPASRTVSTGTTTNCKRGSTPPSSSPSQPLSSSLPSTSSDYLQKRPSEVSSSPKDMNPAQQQAETTTSTTTAPKKKQRADFKFGKILGEGSYSEVRIHCLVPLLLGPDGIKVSMK